MQMICLRFPVKWSTIRSYGDAEPSQSDLFPSNPLLANEDRPDWTLGAIMHYTEDLCGKKSER